MSIEYFKREKSFIIEEMVGIYNRHFIEAGKRHARTIQMETLLRPVFEEIVDKFKEGILGGIKEGDVRVICNDVDGVIVMDFAPGIVNSHLHKTLNLYLKYQHKLKEEV